jgi:hypothetical protein
MKYLIGTIRHLQPGHFPPSHRVKQAKLYALSMGGEHTKIHPQPIPMRAHGKRLARRQSSRQNTCHRLKQKRLFLQKEQQKSPPLSGHRLAAQGRETTAKICIKK